MNRSLRTILGAAVLLLPSLVLADTYIYITNSTPEAVQVEVNHTGSKNTLVEGKEWQQLATEIAPYATEKVLAFNRYWGLKTGANYNFDTKVIAGDSVLTAQQKMQGTWSGSNVQHRAIGEDFNAPWANDRAIHRQQTNYQLNPSTVAYKANYTGGYDDLHYTISNNTQAEPLSAANGLKVLSYNVFALPVIASDIGTRLAEMPDYLHGYDAILLQEMFSSDSPQLLRNLSAEYPYQTEILKNKNGINIHNGGVAIVSRYPIAQAGYVVYPNCTGSDCFADKGFVYAEVIKDNQAYHLVATHAASFDTNAARNIRQQQFQLMNGYITDKEIPVFDAVLYGGDMNINRLKFADDYANMAENLNATVPVTTGYTASTFDPRVNQYAAAYDTVEFLDYVMWSNDHRQPIESRNDVRVPRSTSNNLWGKWDLSDHFPVLGEFIFE